ncbi:hypothetical protein P3X46_014944 [Hevea brasiliensis]|uniref:NAC domain-containing protein n=1 Tax=Hevea brasiliensis TaxID=3981 RepID=A0ABQ9LUB7_HEVBR|nr:NAC domain-containing protein 101 [Hevea brasiliensis]KAJ9171601.1 hypothetical protein P3X46_014944 [Hevea brasiliensis]
MNGRVGYRFHPTDEELVSYFLKHKMAGNDGLVDDDIRLIDLCKFDPWDLPRYAAGGSNDQVWYFFHRRENKYKNTTRQRFNRSTQSGHWKPTGNERTITASRTNSKIGTKRTLVFYKRGSPKEVKTNWVIHEYQPKTPYQTDFVLCKLKEKRDDKACTSACDEDQPSSSRASDHHPIEIPFSQVESELLLESLLASTCEPNFNNPSPEHPQFHMDEGISIDDLMPFFDNDSDRLPEMEEDPNEMADSFIVVPDEHSGEEYLYPVLVNQDDHNRQESARISCNHSSSPNLLGGLYHDDINDDISDMEAEILYERSSQFGASNLNNGHYRQMQTVQTITETVPSSTFDQNGTEKNRILQMDISSPSADSTIDSHEDISVRVVSKEVPVPTRTHKQGSIIQGKLSGASEHKAKKARKPVTALVLPQESPKESINVKTEKDQKTVIAKTNLKLRANATATCNKTDSFIRMETCLSSQSCPPSVYFIKALIGLLLIIVVSREVLILILGLAACYLVFRSI